MFGDGYTLITSLIATVAANSVVSSADTAHTSSNNTTATGSQDLVEAVALARAALDEDEDYPGTNRQA